jgi:NAD(P)-dependent dehydrogenase (short-subunit alcohol dehydrogenase family)
MTDTLFDLSGRVALVTGTSRGLGQYFARALARAGADIAMTSRDRQSLSASADQIRTAGRQSAA